MRRWRIGLGLIVLGIIVTGLILNLTLEPRIRHRVEQILADRFDSGVTIGQLSVTLFPAASVSADRVELRYHHRTDVPPMITIDRISARSDLISLVFGLQHDVRQIVLKGLRITIPAGTLHRRQFERQDPQSEQNNEREGNHLPFVVHRIIADGMTLVILPKKQGRDPLQWDIEKLSMRSVGPKRPMAFIADLTNAKPPGLIHTEGDFGPWQKEDPGGTAVSGTYTFKNADMGVFNGISGLLASDGKYDGSLDHIDVNGTTDIPNFQVGGGRTVDLKTTFSAMVDGTNGDTLLHPVDATFLKSQFICSGGVVSTPGIKGKAVELDVVSKHARIEDILELVMKQNGSPPPLVGDVSFHTKFLLPQGQEPVLHKLKLDGRLGLIRAEFTSDRIQDKLDRYSNRSRGLKGDKRQNDVASNLKAAFRLNTATARFSRLSFTVPGIWVYLDGSYGLSSEEVDFEGRVELEGKLSQMTTGWKSLLLRAADPFFRDGKRTVLPVKISGKRSDPKFTLEWRHHKDDRRPKS